MTIDTTEAMWVRDNHAIIDIADLYASGKLAEDRDGFNTLRAAALCAVRVAIFAIDSLVGEITSSDEDWQDKPVLLDAVVGLDYDRDKLHSAWCKLNTPRSEINTEED